MSVKHPDPIITCDRCGVNVPLPKDLANVTRWEVYFENVSWPGSWLLGWTKKEPTMTKQICRKCYEECKAFVEAKP
jgi:hypothetical protein